MSPEIINSYRFIPNKNSTISLWGASNEQNIAIISSSGNTISLTFTLETTDVIREIISKLSEAYKTLVNTKLEEIQYDVEELNTLD